MEKTLTFWKHDGEGEKETVESDSRTISARNGWPWANQKEVCQRDLSVARRDVFLSYI